MGFVLKIRSVSALRKPGARVWPQALRRAPALGPGACFRPSAKFSPTDFSLCPLPLCRDWQAQAEELVRSMKEDQVRIHVTEAGAAHVCLR